MDAALQLVCKRLQNAEDQRDAANERAERMAMAMEDMEIAHEKAIQKMKEACQKEIEEKQEAHEKEMDSAISCVKEKVEIRVKHAEHMEEMNKKRAEALDEETKAAKQAAAKIDSNPKQRVTRQEQNHYESLVRFEESRFKSAKAELKCVKAENDKLNGKRGPANNTSVKEKTSGGCGCRRFTEEEVAEEEAQEKAEKERTRKRARLNDEPTKEAQERKLMAKEDVPGNRFCSFPHTHTKSIINWKLISIAREEFPSY